MHQRIINRLRCIFEFAHRHLHTVHLKAYVILMRQTQNDAPNHFNSKNGAQMRSSVEQLFQESHTSLTIQDSRLARKILTTSPFYKPPFNSK